MSSHDDEEAARAEAILAAEAEEEAQLELAMQLLRTQTVTAEADTKALFKAAAPAASPKPTAAADSFPPMPSPTPQSDALPAIPAEAGADLLSPPSSSASEGKVLSASPSQPSLSSSSSASALTAPTLTHATASPALSSAPSPSLVPQQKPIIDRKKKSFTTGGMDIDSLMLSSDTDEEERERVAARKAKAAAALASANASKKAAAASATASKQASTASTPKRTPSQSPVRRSSPAPAPRSAATSALRASHGSGLPPRKPASTRPVSGVSPSMLPPAAPASSHKSSRSHRDDKEHAHDEPRGHSSSSHSHSHDLPRESHRSPRPHSASSSAANAALESRIRELEMHYADQSYTRDHNHNHHSRPASSPQNLRLSSNNHPMSPASSSSNSLKLRILELEKDALVSAQTISNLESKLHAMEDQAAQADRTHVRELAVAREREDALRVDLSAQISELDQRNFQLSSELKELKASGAAAASSYRQLVAKDGGSLPASAIPDPTERAKITAELKSSDELINQLVLDSQRIHNEKDSVEKKYKAQIQSLLEDQKHMRLEMQSKDAELTRLRTAHNATLDPSARAELQSFAAREEQLREKHHQEVSSLKYELDKLRAVRLELAITKEDSTRLGKDSLRLSLASLQEKYDALKASKEREVRELHTKLVWYIENQALITDLEASLKALRQENENLKDENLIMNHAIPRAAREEAVAGGVAKLKPRPQDAKRIKELEARNAELTELIKKKASASGVSGTAGAPAPLVGLIAAIKPSMEENSLIQSLRARIAELEAAALARDETSSTALRSLRQETDQIKLLWEKRLAKLTAERDEARKRIPLVGRRKMDRVTELEKQVEEMRAFYTEKTRRMASMVARLKRGENIEDGEMAEAEAEDHTQQTHDQQALQENQQPRTSKDGPHKEPVAVSSHDSQPVPAQASRAAGAASQQCLNHSVLEQARSPLKAHPHPSHPTGSNNGGVSHTNDFLLFKQSLVESHDRELHHLAAKYEQQLQHLKAQWESQVQMLRATAEADSKLQQSLLQQARDECAAVRATLSQESSSRSLLADRCLSLERDLLQARNQGGYIDYHQLRSELDQVHTRFEQKIREYEAAAQISREDIRVERAGWAEQVRSKQEQLEHAKTKFQALTKALKQMQEQMATQQQQAQQPGAVSVVSPGRPAVDLASAASGAASDDDDDIAHLVSPHRASSSSGATTRAPPPPPPVNEQAMQLQWSYLTGGAAPLPSPPQPQTQQIQQPAMTQPQQHTPAHPRPAQRGRTPQPHAASSSRQSSSPSPARDHPVRQGAVHFASHVRG